MPCLKGSKGVSKGPRCEQNSPRIELSIGGFLEQNNPRSDSVPAVAAGPACSDMCLSARLLILAVAQASSQVVRWNYSLYADAACTQMFDITGGMYPTGIEFSNVVEVELNQETNCAAASSVSILAAPLYHPLAYLNGRRVGPTSYHKVACDGDVAHQATFSSPNCSGTVTTEIWGTSSYANRFGGATCIEWQGPLATDGTGAPLSRPYVMGSLAADVFSCPSFAPPQQSNSAVLSLQSANASIYMGPNNECSVAYVPPHATFGGEPSLNLSCLGRQLALFTSTGSSRRRQLGEGHQHHADTIGAAHAPFGFNTEELHTERQSLPSDDTLRTDHTTDLAALKTDDTTDVEALRRRIDLLEATVLRLQTTVEALSKPTFSPGEASK